MGSRISEEPIDISKVSDMKQMTEAPCPSPHRCPESGTVGPTNYDVECFFAKYPNYIYIYLTIYITIQQTAWSAIGSSIPQVGM